MGSLPFDAGCVSEVVVNLRPNSPSCLRDMGITRVVDPHEATVGANQVLSLLQSGSVQIFSAVNRLRLNKQCQPIRWATISIICRRGAMCLEPSFCWSSICSCRCKICFGKHYLSVLQVDVITTLPISTEWGGICCLTLCVCPCVFVWVSLSRYLWNPWTTKSTW